MVKGVAAHLWQVNPIIEAVLATRWDGAASTHYAPVATRQTSQKLSCVDVPELFSDGDLCVLAMID